MIKRAQIIELSIVICTRNRAKSLDGMLGALSRIRSDRDWEVLLVDNASTDDTATVLAAADTLGGRLRLMRVDRIGLGNARDAAWRETRGAIVAFTDDDCYVDPGFVDAMLAVFDERADLGCAGGRILLYDPDDFPVTIDLRETRAEIPPLQFVPTGALQGANFAFRREALEAIGGIDTDFGAGTPFPCEDIDAVAGVAWAGMPSVFDPRPVVQHHHGRKAADFPKLMAGYDRGRGAYYAKYLLRSDSRSAYLNGWIGDRFSHVHRDSLQSFGRELASAFRYVVHRRRFGFLLLAAPVAAYHYARLVAMIALRKLGSGQGAAVPADRIEA